MCKLFKLSNIRTIKIPVGLAENIICERNVVNKYETNKVIRAVDTWLCLKSETTTGIIQFYDKQLPELIALCKVSRASFYSRLKYLHTEKLIEWDKKNKRITLCSWQKFAQQFDVNENEFTTLTYYLNDNRKIYQFLSAIEIENNQKKQRDALLYRINKNPELKSHLTKLMIDAGADRAKLNDPQYFQQTLWHLQLESFKTLESGTEIYALLHSYHADTNRSVNKAFKSAWNVKAAQTISYWKKVLQKAGIIAIDKVSVVSRVRARKHKDFRVKWLQNEKQTIWFIPDQIKVIASAEPLIKT